MKCEAEFLVEDLAATLAAAGELGALLQPGDCVELVGELGAGKTTFTKGIGAARGIPPLKIASPSFTLVHSYRDAHGGTLLHADGFRLRGAVEADGLGLDESAGSILVVEWAGPLLHVLPRDRLRVSIAQAEAPGARHLIASAWDERGQALLADWMEMLSEKTGVVRIRD